MMRKVCQIYDVHDCIKCIHRNSTVTVSFTSSMILNKLRVVKNHKCVKDGDLNYSTMCGCYI